MSIIFNTIDKIKYANTKAECRIHQFDVFDVVKLCYNEKLNKHQILYKTEYCENHKLYAGFAIYHPSEDYVLSHGTFGDYFVQFKDSLATIIKAKDFKKMHKNDFIELHTKLVEKQYE